MASFSWSPLQESEVGVVSVNGLSGALTLAAGTGISITPSGNTLTFAATGGGDVTLTAVGSTPNANGASLSGQALTLQPANTSFPGVLLAADWNTFNSKQAAGNYITALTGDGTASGPGFAALTLATVNGNVGSFGIAASVSQITVNAKGLVTAAANVAIQIAESQVTNLVSDLAGKQATGNYITDLTGDATASGPGSVALTLATVNGNVGSFGSSTSIPTFTVNAKGLVTAASGNVVIAPAGTLTGATLAANVLASSLTSVGTIATGTWSATTIAVNKGGTGITSGTSGGALYFSGTGTIASSALLAQYGVMLGGGAGNPPATLAPDASTTKVLTSGGTGANPSWASIATSSFGTQTAGTFLSGPTSGSAANPTFRALQAPTVQTFTSGTAATYTTPAGVLYLRVRMVGGGSGGGGGGTAGAGTGQAGGATLWKNGAGATTYLTANGAAVSASSLISGAGGTATLANGAIGTAIAGARGGGSSLGTASFGLSGGPGASSPFGGAGAGGFNSGALAPVANTGSGGAGGETNGTALDSSGCGGSAGGFVDAIIPVSIMAATFQYTVGAAGTAGGAGTNGGAGTAGSAGYIEVTEYYQ